MNDYSLTTRVTRETTIPLEYIKTKYLVETREMTNDADLRTRISYELARREIFARILAQR